MKPSDINVLIGCEFSGIVRDAFISRGFNAVSCDILPTESPGPHIQGNIMDILDDNWDLGIFHPPCTYICNSSASHLYIDKKKENGINEERWHQMIEGALFFKDLLEAPISHIAVENPVMLGYAKRIIGQDYAQTIQPYEFGHPESKRTCLWLKNLPDLEPTEILEPQWKKNPDGTDYRDSSGSRYSETHYNPPAKWKNQTPSGQNKLGPSPDRGKIRSITYKGIAEGMAQQWGDYLLNQ